MGSRIIASLDTQKNYALNTLVVVTPKPDCRWSTKALLALLNSTLLNFFYVTFLKSSKRVFSEIQARQIAQLPIPAIDWKDVTQAQKHDKLVRLVDEITRLRVPEKNARPSGKLRNLSSRIQEVDREIDELVYKLYGVTRQERKIIEETT